MKRILTIAFTLYISITFAQYKAPYFEDTNRLQKIKKVIPTIESLYKKYAITNNLPGLAFGIMVDGKLIYSGFNGFSNIESQIPANNASVFRIASMSKSFTAMAIVKLRDEGKIALEKPAYLYYPILKKLKYLTTDAPHITVKDLLTHGAGFPEDNPWGDRQLADDDKDLTTLLQQQISFSTVPNSSYEYSNLGFALLGKIISNVSGMPYQKYIKKAILNPLKMYSTTFEFSEVVPNNLAHGYRMVNDKWQEETLVHDPKNGSWGAMGAMLTTIEDFAKYMQLHQSAYPIRNGEESTILKRSSLREMHHPFRPRAFNTKATKTDGSLCPLMQAYAYGLVYSKDCDNVEWVGHAGGLPGFGSQWRFLPQYGIGIVSFANKTYSPMTKINTIVMDSLIKIAQLKPLDLPASNILLQRQKELINILPSWTMPNLKTIFAENFFLDNPIDVLKEDAQSIFNKIGKIKSVGKLIPENQLRGYFDIVGENGIIEVFFTLTPENPTLIQQLDLLLK